VPSGGTGGGSCSISGITANTGGITFEFWSRDGKKLDSVNVPKSCP